MSQIETIMLVTLGLVVAALIALVVSRVGWSFAAKLANRRTERDAPAKIAALQAERDQLRAEYAMLTRKMELRLDDLKTRLAEQTAEVSRNRNRIDHMVNELAKRDATISERDQAVAAVQEHIIPLEEELAVRTSSAQKLKEQLNDRDDEISRLSSQMTGLHSQLGEKDHELKRLRDELSGVPAVPELSEQAVQVHSKLHQRIEELTALSSQIERQRNELNTQYQAFVAQQHVEPGDALGQQPELAKMKPAAKSKGSQSKHSATGKSKRARKPQKAAGKVSAELLLIEDVNRKLANKIDSAEEEARSLKSELADLDDVWKEKLDELQQVARSAKGAPGGIGAGANLTGAKRTDTGSSTDSVEKAEARRSFHNVISLAARIRALQRKSAE